MPLVRRGPGIVGMAARTAVVAGTAGAVQHRQQRRWAEREQQAYQEQAPPPQAAPPPGAAEPDYTAELEKLAKLRDEGVI